MRVRGVAGSGKTVVRSNWLAKTAKRLIGEQGSRIWAVYATNAAFYEYDARLDVVVAIHFKGKSPGNFVYDPNTN